MGWGVDVAAATLGASVIEKHYCISREQKTVDSEFSMEPAEFKAMIRDVRRAKASIGHVTYERTEKEEKGLPGRRSLYAVKDIARGEAFTNENVRSIRPAYGWHPSTWMRCSVTRHSATLSSESPSSRPIWRACSGRAEGKENGLTKKCLVIGASSFIGVYVVDALLDAGYEVVGTGRNRRFAGHYRKLGVEYIPLDLNDPSGIGALPTDFDFVAHLAGGCLQTRTSTCPLRTTPLNISGRTPWEPHCFSSGRARTACAA